MKLTSWNSDFSVCKICLTLNSSACPGKDSSETSLNHPFWIVGCVSCDII